MAVEPVIRRAGKFRGLAHAHTSFVGRSREISKVVGLLGTYRLVTVTGPGGVGKTRLADKVLMQVADQFADGVAIVELAAVSEPALVAATAATALEVHQAAGMSIVDALAEHLSRQQLFLVLDNCEHVLDEVARLCAALLVSADDIKILATSRVPMGLPEESLYRLAPLELPSSHARGTEVQGEAVALFIERACQLNPDFTVDDDAGALLARLVQRLDGMPLAIELAAARVEALGVAQLLDRLDGRFRLLVSGNRAAAARQRSLEATVDWSYQLLSGYEQRVFRHLAVFPGPFTLDAAEAVAGAEAGLAVLRLVDCSLLVPPTTGPDRRSRYLMLEMLRGYGLDRLREAGEEHDAAAALAGYALGVAERATAQMWVRSGELSGALWLDAEDAALRQGLGWALDHDPPAALRLGVALAAWWLIRGRWIHGYALLRRAVEQTSPPASPWYTARVWLGLLASATFDIPSAIGHFSTVIDALEDGPASQDPVDALVARCALRRNSADLGNARADAHAALELARTIGYAAGEVMALAELGLISSYAGEDEQAVEWARQAQRIDHEQMPGWQARKAEIALPYVMVMGRRLDDAMDLCVRTLAQARAAGDLIDQSDVLFVMAVLARKTGRLAEAGDHLHEAVQVAAQASYRMRFIDGIDEGGHWCAATGRYEAAVTLWSARKVHGEITGFADTSAEERERQEPLQKTRQALKAQQLQAAEERGAAMTLAAAVEFAIMMTREHPPSASTPRVPGKLSERELELITLVAQGQTDAQIAQKLFISVSTVRTHLDRIRDKSGCRRRADLTRLALQEGII